MDLIVAWPGLTIFGEDIWGESLMLELVSFGFQKYCLVSIGGCRILEGKDNCVPISSTHECCRSIIFSLKIVVLFIFTQK